MICYAFFPLHFNYSGLYSLHWLPYLYYFITKLHRTHQSNDCYLTALQTVVLSKNTEHVSAFRGNMEAYPALFGQKQTRQNAKMKKVSELKKQKHFFTFCWVSTFASRRRTFFRSCQLFFPIYLPVCSPRNTTVSCFPFVLLLLPSYGENHITLISHRFFLFSLSYPKYTKDLVMGNGYETLACPIGVLNSSILYFQFLQPAQPSSCLDLQCVG